MMGKQQIAGPGSPRCKGLFTPAYYDPQIRGDVDSAAASSGYLKDQHVKYFSIKMNIKMTDLFCSVMQNSSNATLEKGRRKE